MVGTGIILQDAPKDFIFHHDDFLSKMLNASKSYGQKFAKSIRNALIHSAVFQSEHGTPGQPMVEDVELKEYFQKMMSVIPLGSLEYELFESLFKHANREIDSQLRMDEEFLE